MLRLRIEVPEARDLTASATLRIALQTVATGQAVATATPAIAAAHANPDCDPLRLCGHPPLGSYTLTHHAPAEPRQKKEYGAHLLLFEPDSGAALQAEAFGRLALLVYGGAAGRDGKLRRTQGGVRLSNEMLNEVAIRLALGGDIKLDLVTLRPRRWWQFWKRRVETQPLSTTQPEALAAPLDELSLLSTLLERAGPRVRRPEMRDGTTDSDRSRGTSSSSSGGDSFSGKGGTSGGAGASGSWGETGTAARGVDSAGRIGAAAAAVGAVGTLAAIAHATAGANQAGGESDPAASSGEPGTGADTSSSTAY